MLGHGRYDVANVYEQQTGVMYIKDVYTTFSGRTGDHGQPKLIKFGALVPECTGHAIRLLDKHA